MELLHELRSTAFHPDWPGYDHDCYWAPNLSAEKTNTEPPTWHHPLEWSASYLVVGWLHWPTSIMTGQHFVCTGIDNHCGHRLASFVHNASVKTTICGRIERSIYHHGITHNIASNQGTHLTAKKSVAMGPCSWNLLVSSCSPPSWNNWLDWTVEWPCKTQL